MTRFNQTRASHLGLINTIPWVQLLLAWTIPLNNLQGLAVLSDHNNKLERLVTTLFRR